MASSDKRVGLPMTSEQPTNQPAPEQPAAAQTSTSPAVELDGEQLQKIEEQIVEALKTCYDPEVPVNIYELGLIYGVTVSPAGAVHVRMTLTSPACPAAASLPPEVQNKVKAVPGVTGATVDVVWEPPWHQGLMSDAARLQLGLDW
jgi:FeS assembly SUF system protein